MPTAWIHQLTVNALVRDARPDIGALVGIDPETGSDGLGQCLDSRDFFTDEAIPQSGFQWGRMPRFYMRQYRSVLR